MRNTAISNSSRYRPSASGISSFTLTWLRSEKPLTYQRSAEARPTSSSMGGWRRYEIVRISRNASLVRRGHSSLNFIFLGGGGGCCSLLEKFLLTAPKNLPPLSCHTPPPPPPC